MTQPRTQTTTQTTTLSAKLAKFWAKFWDELPTRLFLMLFMFSGDRAYGNGAWYKPLGGRKLTPREIEEAKFSPDNYRSGSHNDAADVARGYDKLLAIRNMPLAPTN